MPSSSSLIDDPQPLVLDTSVVINLHACSYGERILIAIPNDILVPKIVAGELEHETSRKNGEQSFLHGLAASGKVTLANMTDEEYELFHQLTSGPSSLDDGEAATIAIAATRHFIPVIDEKKGRARASALIETLEPGWSLDLLRHPLVVASLGDQVAIDALYLALRHGRMRIPSDRAEYIIGLIGQECSNDCTCLPGYRERFSGRRH
jgi:predicted nucleic acid-binding protein